MSASPTPPAAKRFAPYVDELQEFFASACLRYGSPEDIIAVTERLESSPAFAEDLGSMIRAIVLREGGSLQHSEVLEILAVAIGGPRMDHAPQHYAQPLRNLLSFMTGVLRKPWNEPPETITVERAEVLPFPTHPPAHPKSADGHRHTHAAAISAATISAATEAAAAERLRHPQPDAAVQATQSREHPVPEALPQPAATVADAPPSDNSEDKNIDKDERAAAVMETAASSVSSNAPATPPMPGAPPAVESAPASEPSDTPSWQLAAKALRAGDADPATIPRVTVEPPNAVPDSPAVSERQTPVAPPTRHRPYTPRIPQTAAGMLVAGAALLVLAGIVATSLRSTPTVLVGKQSVAQPPGSGQVVLPGGIASTPSAQRSTKASAAVPVVPASVAPARRAIALEEDDDAGAAAPFSTPIPGQVLAKPSAYGQSVVAPAAPSSQASAASQTAPIVRPSRPPSDEIASAATPSQPPGATPGPYPQANSYAGGQPIYHQELRAAYRDPDAAIAGDLPRRTVRTGALSDRPSYLDVSSGVMAGNLIAAPMPDYPTLARLAHVSGEVVLQAVVAKNGSVLATHVLRGNRLLRGAAEDAVRQWRYRPYAIDGRPVEVATIVTVRFHKSK